MKNKKIITCLLILVTFCIGISNVGATPYNTSNSSAKTCMNYKKKTSCNNNVSCKWVDSVCRVKTCTNLTDSDTCSKNTDKNKNQCKWKANACCPNGKCSSSSSLTDSVSKSSTSTSTATESVSKSSNSVNHVIKSSAQTASTKKDGSLKGCNVFGPKTSGLLKWGIHLIQIAAPLLVVALGITDFLKILLSGEEKEYKESGKKFIKRLLALVALELLPYVLFFIIDISGVASQYGIERGEIYCVLEF
mgnify:CR=1 FL=1